MAPPQHRMRGGRELIEIEARDDLCLTLTAPRADWARTGRYRGADCRLRQPARLEQREQVHVAETALLLLLAEASVSQPREREMARVARPPPQP